MDSLKLLDETPAYFCGITNRLLLPSYAENQKAIDHLANVAMLEPPGDNVAELEIKMSHIIEERFFSNVTFRNFLAWPLQNEIEGVIRQPRAAAVDFGIEIISDFNDRFAFNERANYHVDKEGMLLVVSKGFAEIDRLERLFERGEKS